MLTAIRIYFHKERSGMVFKGFFAAPFGPTI
jgi:hypothetical protein